MLCGFRAEVENLNNHSEAELRRQYEERQQETERQYELLENKIQLLQEVGGISRAWGVLSSLPLLLCLLAVILSASTFFPNTRCSVSLCC